jgi:hypothetical protein
MRTYGLMVASLFTCEPPLGSLEEPLVEWPMELLDYPCGPARNDVYGKMFYYVRDLFVAFQKRIKGIVMTMHIISEDLEDIPDWAVANQRIEYFDRIEVTGMFFMNQNSLANRS